MPYITQEDRLRAAKLPETPEELNYAITTLSMEYLISTGKQFTYAGLNEVIGVLACAQHELYRRVLGPFEEVKCQENGDVY